MQSKLTLVLLLVVFVSQLFPTCVASDIHINELTSLEHSQELSQGLLISESEEQESCCHQPGSSCAHSRSTTERDEHDGDFHTACHPPIELSFFTHPNHSQDNYLFAVHYQNRSYAPPIPPPHVWTQLYTISIFWISHGLCSWHRYLYGRYFIEFSIVLLCRTGADDLNQWFCIADLFSTH